MLIHACTSDSDTLIQSNFHFFIRNAKKLFYTHDWIRNFPIACASAQASVVVNFPGDLFPSFIMVTMKASTLKRLLNWYPPFIGAGIRAKQLSPDFRHAVMEMRLTWYNRNYVNSHFGGSLYAMCDPMYMLMLLNILGSDYIVWDKAASIEYVKPGRTTVTAEFRISDDLVHSLRAMEPNERKVFDLHVDVMDTAGEVVARVTKTEYVNRKPLQAKL